MITKKKAPPPAPPWQDPKRLSSGDKIWILTDIATYESAMYHWASEQTWYSVGAYDFRTGCIGFLRFSKDDARGMLRAGLPPPPWTSAQPRGIEVARRGHEGGEEKGRFAVRMKLFDVPPEVLAIEPAAKSVFKHTPHTPNATPDMWKALVDAVAKEKRIESAALSMVGWFSAGDVQAIVGVGENVTPVLTRLADEERLHRIGKTRGTKYMIR